MNRFSDTTVAALIRWSLNTGGPRGAHITRLSMYRALAGRLAAEDSPHKRALCISRSRSLARDVLGLRACELVDANYPQHDIRALNFPDESFDFCVSDQVLEHVEGDPFAAFAETARVVRRGGLLCHTTCFINEVHEAPHDYWRFTPAALKLMAQAAGCEVLQTGGWGNREAWALIGAGFRFEGIPLDETHPLHELAVRNEPDVPISVWIVARRPA